MDVPIVQWESNNDGQPNLWFGFSNKFNAYLGPPEHIEDVGTDWFPPNFENAIFSKSKQKFIQGFLP